MKIKWNEGLKINKEQIWKICLWTDVNLSSVVSYYMVWTLIKIIPYPFICLGLYHVHHQIQNLSSNHGPPIVTFDVNCHLFNNIPCQCLSETVSAPLHTVWDSYSLDCTPFGTVMVILVFVPNDFPILSAIVCIAGLINCDTWVLHSVETTETLLLELLLLSIWILFAPFVSWGLLL